MKFIGYIFLIHLSTGIFSQFVDRANALGIKHIHGNLSLVGGGVAFLDVNNDNLIDIYLTGGDQNPDKLFLNIGNNKFVDRTFESGIFFQTRYVDTFGVISGDVNNDGCEDLFLTTHSTLQNNILLAGDCEGNFEDISAMAGINEKSRSTSASFLDFNQDGFLDIYVTNYTDELNFIRDENDNVIGYEHICFPNFLYLNNGDLSFTEVGNQYGVDDIGCGFTSSTSDFDQDGDPDIYVINDFGEWVFPNAMLENLDGSSFENISDSTGLGIGLYGMGVASSDFDHDGDVDFYVTNIGKNSLMVNDGSNNYLDLSDQFGVSNTFSSAGSQTTGWGTFFADLDNNGYQDLVVANGYIPAAPFLNNSLVDESKVFYNYGSSLLVDVSDEVFLNSDNINRGTIYGDINNDGNLDVFVVTSSKIDNGSAVNNSSLVYVNQNLNGNWLQVDIEGTVSNRNAFGAFLYAYTNGHLSMVEKLSGGSHASQNSEIIHFGLGSYDIVDSLVIKWPSGLESSFFDLEVNKRIQVIENDDYYQVLDCSNMSYRCFYHQTKGCLDPNSSNYNIYANIDDGSCDNVVALGISESINSNVFFPNPFNEKINIDSQQMFNRVEIYDLTSRLVYSSQFSPTQNFIVNTSKLNKGVYIIKCFSFGDLKSSQTLQKR